MHVPLSMVRHSRFKPNPDSRDAYYHLSTRIVAGDWLLGAVEKEILRKNIWLVAERFGIQIVTYAIMSNHLHVVAYAPRREPLTDRELLRRYCLIHCGTSLWEQLHLAALERSLTENSEEAAAWRDAELRKMSDISEYMKLLKQRFSIWYNRAHDRFGTLWAERFKSTLLESGIAVSQCAAYVDTNPIRARICKDPKDYRFSGYAEAVAGNQRARAGIAKAVCAGSWKAAHNAYRMALFVRASRPSKSGKTAVSASAAAEVFTKGGQISPTDFLRCRCRYFTQGAVLGSKAFVAEQLAIYQQKTGRGQRTRPREVPELSPDLAVLRNIAPV